MSVVYLIRNLINGKVYVGQTTLTLRDRWNCHLSAARNTSKPSYFQRAIKKYGADNFSIEVLIETDYETVNQLETFYIQKLDSTNHERGYNIQAGGRDGEIGGGRPVGIPVTQEHRDKLRRAHLGKTHSAEHNQHVSESLMGDKNLHFGSSWMHKDKEEKLVSKDAQASFAQSGWELGRPSAVTQANEMRKKLVWTPELRAEAAQRARNQRQNRGESGRFQCS